MPLHQTELQKLSLNHDYVGDLHDYAERRTQWVLAVTLFWMVVEIVAGHWYASMALLADGWHMASHAAAFGISVFAYYFARKHAHSGKYSFGTWKVSVLAGFASAVLLGLIGVGVLLESFWRAVVPEPIHYNQAIAVSVLGLVINLVSAVILHQKTPHHHDHDDACGDHDHGHHHHDLNHRSAYLHVIADAMTSVLAIAALFSAKWWDLPILDPVAGFVGGVLIVWWALQLLKQSTGLLIDQNIAPGRLQQIRSAIESVDDNRISDMHIWKIGPSHYAAIIAVVTHHPKPPGDYKALLSGFPELAHISIEVNGCNAQAC